MSKIYTAAELKLMLVEAEKREALARESRVEIAHNLFNELADINPKLADKALAKLQKFAAQARKSAGAPSKTGARHRRAETSSRSTKREDGVSQSGPQADDPAGPRGNA